MPRYWFKPHRYGYGATPTTWQGWAFTLFFVVVAASGTLALASWLKTSPWRAWGGPALLLFALLLAAPFLWFCRRKTDGAWRWRSGGESAP